MHPRFIMSLILLCPPIHTAAFRIWKTTLPIVKMIETWASQIEKVWFWGDTDAENSDQKVACQGRVQVHLLVHLQ